VASRKKEIGYDGALILSPTHILEPEVPVENVVAFVESCRE
jgi:uroporphyrinogen decarboxylase